MNKIKLSFRLTLIIGLLVLAGCSPTQAAVGGGSRPAPAAVPSAAPTATLEPSPTADPTATQAPSPTPSSLPSASPVPSPTATWAVHPAGKVVAPILLYHHVNNDQTDSRYVVSVAVFTAQMKALRDWGYTVIPISTLVEALTHGGPLPERPVVISFDDGNEDIYQNAFPIMQQFGYPGTFFIVADRLSSPGFVSTADLKQMAAAGWEIDSHSWSHIDLTKNHAAIWQEAAHSRLVLKQALGAPVEVFAYPYGTVDPTVIQKLQEYGYRAAAGLGTLNTQTVGMLYYLSRQEVRRDYSMEAFSKLLPWSPGNPG